mgnify:CR=1 FL=1
MLDPVCSTVYWLIGWGVLDCDCCVAGVDAILEPYFTTLDSIRGHAAVWDPDSFVGAHACKRQNYGTTMNTKSLSQE